MSTLEVSPAEAHVGQRPGPIVNDFSIQVATVNGSGSQTANNVLMRSIFQMGIPVSGKNMFPSNIAGLPTWFTIRASKTGHVARRKEIDFLIAMNPETAREDVMKLDIRRRRGLRRAAQAQRPAQRSPLLSRSVRQTRGAGVSRGQAAQAGAQHDLRRRSGVGALHRNGGNAQRPGHASSASARPRPPISTGAPRKPATITPRRPSPRPIPSASRA